MPAEEVWRDIDLEEFPNYQVSNLGRVKRLETTYTISNPTRIYTLKERILKGSFTKRLGYFVYLFGQNEIVARLMLTAFVRPPEENEVARHLDDNKKNQALNNLAWGTQKDNVHDAIRNGRSSKGSAKLTKELVREIKKAKGKQNNLAKKYGVNQSTISRIVSGDRWANI